MEEEEVKIEENREMKIKWGKSIRERKRDENNESEEVRNARYMKQRIRRRMIKVEMRKQEEEREE